MRNDAGERGDSLPCHDALADMPAVCDGQETQSVWASTVEKPRNAFPRRAAVAQRTDQHIGGRISSSGQGCQSCRSVSALTRPRQPSESRTTEGVKQKGTLPMLHRWHFPGQAGQPGHERSSPCSCERWPVAAGFVVNGRIASRWHGHSSEQHGRRAASSLSAQQLGSLGQDFFPSQHWESHRPKDADMVAGAVASRYASRQASDTRRRP